MFRPMLYKFRRDRALADLSHDQLWTLHDARRLQLALVTCLIVVPIALLAAFATTRFLGWMTFERLRDPGDPDEVARHASNYRIWLVIRSVASVVVGIVVGRGLVILYLCGWVWRWRDTRRCRLCGYAFGVPIEAARVCPECRFARPRGRV